MNRLENDRSIRSRDEDRLARGELAARLSDCLIDPSTSRATGLVVGLAGSWGSGKSSVISLVEEELRRRHKDVALVVFNPWQVSGEDTLLTGLVNELVDVVNQLSVDPVRKGAVLQAFLRYGGRLAGSIPIFGRGIADAAGAVEKDVAETYSVAALRDEIKQKLATFPYPIVVLIDEIDRLDDSEVRVIAKIVKAVIDFEGVSYLLAYDRERVALALGHGSRERGEAYLEKIVQLQVPLPGLSRAELRTSLIDLLAASGVFDRHLAGWRTNPRLIEVVDYLAENTMATIRDVKRLAASFNATSRLVGSELDPIDLLAFVALRLRVPEIDRLILDRVDILNLVEEEYNAYWHDAYKVATDISQVEEDPVNKQLFRLSFSLDHVDKPRKTADELLDRPHMLGRRRTLASLLRLSMPTPFFPRGVVEGLFSEPHERIASVLREADQSLQLPHLRHGILEYCENTDRATREPFWRENVAVIEALRHDGSEAAVRLRLGDWLAELFCELERASLGYPVILAHFAEEVLGLDASLLPRILVNTIKRARHTDLAARAGSLTATGPEQNKAVDLARPLAQSYATRALTAAFLMQIPDLKPIELLLWTRLWNAEHETLVSEAWRDSPEWRRHLAAIALSAHLYYGAGEGTDWVFRQMFGSSVAFAQAIAETLADPNWDEDRRRFLVSLAEQS